MATVSWTGGNGDWTAYPSENIPGGFWSTGEPGSGDDAVISTASVVTVTFIGQDDYTVNSLTVGNDHFDMSGGTLEIISKASFADGLTQSGGNLVGAATIALNGSSAITGGYAGGTLSFQVSAVTALADYTLGGATTWVNKSTTNQTGQITLGDNTGANATITNNAGATYNIAGDFGITEGAATAAFVNSGKLAKSAGSATSNVAVAFTNTGSISVIGGSVLEFSGPSNSFAGTMSGAGTIALGGGGVDTLVKGAVVSSNGLGLFDNATRLTLDENLTYAGAFNQNAGSTLFLNATTLTLTGAASFAESNFEAPTIASAGTLITGGVTSIGEVTLGGTVTWENSGRVNETNTLILGDSSGQAVEFENLSGAVYDLTNDSGIVDGASTASNFITSGTLADTDGTGVSTIAANVVDNGAIQVVAGGDLAFTGPINFFTGTIFGNGTLGLGGAGVDTIESGTTLSIAHLQLFGNGTEIVLEESLTYVGTFGLSGSSSLDLDGNTLTLNGAVSFFNQNFGTPVVDGSGTLITKGATNVSQFVVGGTAAWQNYGTVSETALLTLDDTTGQSVTVTNEAKAVYNLTNGSGMADGPSLASTFVNLGTLNDLYGAGLPVSTINVNVVDSGTITVAGGGELEFTGPINSFTGTISGSGQFAIGGGSSMISNGTTISAAGFGIYDAGTVVVLGEKLTYAGNFTEGNASTLDLNGNTLTLTGGATFSNINFGTPTIDGSGTLITRSATSVNLLVLGGSATWQNYGSVSETAALTLGDNSGQAVTFTNEAGATYALTNDSGIFDGASAASQFVNAGTLNDTDSIGATSVNVDVTDTGAISVVAYGQLQFNGPISQFAGTISGPGLVSFGGGGSDTINTGTAMTIANWAIVGNNTTVTLNESLAYSGFISASFGTSLVVSAGSTLTLTGTTALTGASSGAGTLTVGGGMATINNDASFGTAAVVVSGKGTTLNIATTGTDATTLTLGAGTTTNIEIYQGLTLTGNTTVAGTITGNGSLVLSGNETLNAGAALSMSALTETFGTTKLATNITYLGNFVQTGGTISVAGETLQFSGPAAFNGGTIVGASGRFVTAGVTTLQSLAVTGGATWLNTGFVVETGNIVLGSVGNQLGRIGNNAGATFDITADVGMQQGAGGTSAFVNSALLEKTGGTGISTIQAPVTNSGTIYAGSGTLDLAGAVTGTGGASIAANAALQFDGSVASTQTITFSSTPGGELVLNDPSGPGLGFTAGIAGFGAGDTIDLPTFASASGEKATWTQTNSKQGTLVVTDGAKTASILLFGQYTASGFGVSSDGHGDTSVSYTPPAQVVSIATPHH